MPRTTSSSKARPSHAQGRRQFRQGRPDRRHDRGHDGQDQLRRIAPQVRVRRRPSGYATEADDGTPGYLDKPRKAAAAGSAAPAKAGTITRRRHLRYPRRRPARLRPVRFPTPWGPSRPTTRPPVLRSAPRIRRRSPRTASTSASFSRIPRRARSTPPTRSRPACPAARSPTGSIPPGMNETGMYHTHGNFSKADGTPTDAANDAFDRRISRRRISTPRTREAPAIPTTAPTSPPRAAASRCTIREPAA